MLELLITLGILGIVLVLGIPNMIAMLDRSELTQTGRQVEILLQKARREAIKQERVVRVVASGRTVQGYVDEDGDGVQDPPEQVLGTVRVPPRLTWDATRTDFAFLPNGSAQTLGDYGFHNEAGDSLRIRLTSLATSNVEFEKSW